MKVLINPSESELTLALSRPKLESVNLDSLISEVFAMVEAEKDEALKRFTLQFDQARTDCLLVSDKEFEEAEQVLPPKLKTAIQTAAQNIERFHRSQENRETEVETTPGVLCWRKSVPIQTVGLYIPGGTAPLFSTVLMLGIPAKIASNPVRYLCTPPNKVGRIHPAILFAAKTAGIESVYKVGGAQAIAAMSLGTENIPKADKIFGPGNQYVTAAKVYAQSLGIAIDMPAGPSEVLVAADDSIPAAFVAADLLAQAEHGTDSHVVFLTDNPQYLQEVLGEVEYQLKELPRAEIAREALNSSAAFVVEVEKWAGIINSYAPEHLIVMGEYEDLLARKVTNAGSVFIGRNSAESFGDYASGTNHTLPTAGFARAYSGVSLDSFVKKITYQKVSNEGLKNLGQTVITMAEAEGLQGHANAVKVRLKAGFDSAQSTFVPGLSSLFASISDIEKFIREDLRNIRQYSSARDEYEGMGEVFLDANENSLVTGYNRYPDPQQKKLKEVIAGIKGLNPDKLFLGNGSDEVLDLIFRLTTCPFLDSVAYLNPSYGMYSVLTQINGLRTKEINLSEDFRVTSSEILLQSKGAKLLIICNPNNPTGGVISREELIRIVREFEGLVVIDEAYIDFCPAYSLVDEVENYPNLIVVQTLSKAYGMAGLRIGMAIASKEWITALNRIKPPYNLSSPVQETAMKELETISWKEVRAEIIRERKRLSDYLKSNSAVTKVFPSEANFILFRVPDASKVYKKLIENGIVVRDRSNLFNCSDTLRVSIGTKAENDQFIQIMQTL
ncbi:MAG: Histidinol-phosphate aminotransferase [Fluviicola sp.]|jgi:histidinol dehydrogenase|uniref:histidinol dehydrogenase n=1 Tax=Fluviicola sp. TaxID=1917219 RepID=UPI00260AB53F|nr:histidinol dehydrogenase [Fluviicola sp.]MDF3026233.1 Histidinol-phosphate aminotransferase [Fluviicola sp.]